jgi:Uma2 family endonuclease
MPNVSVYTDKKVWTYKDYCYFPEMPYFYLEILDGELKMVAKPIPVHQWVALRLTSNFVEKVENKGLGYVLQEVDVLSSEKRVVAPDIVIVKKENSHIITKKNIRGVPDMVVEIVSPSTRRYDLGEKKNFYEQLGIKEYWACDYRNKEVQVFNLKDDKFDANTYNDIVHCVVFDIEIDVGTILNNIPFPFSQ